MFLSQISRYFYKSSKKEFCEVSHFVRMCYNLFHFKISFYFWTHFQLNVSMQTLYEGKTCSILTAYSTVNVLIILPLTRPISYLIPIHITRYCNFHMYAHAIKNQNVQILNLFTWFDVLQPVIYVEKNRFMKYLYWSKHEFCNDAFAAELIHSSHKEIYCCCKIKTTGQIFICHRCW